MKSASFIDFLDSYGSLYPPSMTYQDGENFADWQQRFYKAVASLRGPLPERVTPDVEVIDTIEEPDHTRQVLRILVSECSTLVAYLLVPKGVKEGERRPGLIVSHGHSKHGIDEICGVESAPATSGAYAISAVRAGYVVLAPAWWGWTGRNGHVDRIGNKDKCNVIQTMAAMYGVNVLSLHIQDGEAAVDVLAGRPEVDGARIGCIGNSYGGRSTMWMAIFDKRIKACVASGCMNTFRERSLKLSCCGIQYLPGVLRYGDVPELFSLIAPRPMQMQAGEGDRGITDSDRDAMLTTVQKAYRLSGAADNLDYTLHPDGHQLRWDLAESFLKRHLGATIHP